LLALVESVPTPSYDAQVQRTAVGRIASAFGWIDRLAHEATSARKLVDHLDQASRPYPAIVRWPDSTCPEQPDLTVRVIK
jgi:hypothetical protein